MGYRIVYGPEVTVRQQSSNTGRLRTMIALAFLLLAVLIRLTWQEGAELLREVIVPGDLTVTEQAFGEMIREFRDGVRISDAVYTFCHTVMNGTY